MAVDQKPQDYKGPRTPIQLENPCGFCNAGDHHMCMHELPYYEKLWICGCECNKGWKPIDLGGETSKKRRTKDEVRTVQLPIESRSDASSGSAPSSIMRESSSEGSSDSVEKLGVDSNFGNESNSNGDEEQEELQDSVLD
jgi:hypothetical protein